MVMVSHMQKPRCSYLPALSHVRVGKSRALGITSTVRFPAAPDIPTIAEQGVAGYEAYGRNGMLAPAGTPRLVPERAGVRVD